jgi:hypothetical protein
LHGKGVAVRSRTAKTARQCLARQRRRCRAHHQNCTAKTLPCVPTFAVSQDPLPCSVSLPCADRPLPCGLSLPCATPVLCRVLSRQHTAKFCGQTKKTENGRACGQDRGVVTARGGAPPRGREGEAAGERGWGSTGGARSRWGLATACGRGRTNDDGDEQEVLGPASVVEVLGSAQPRREGTW